MNIFGWKSAGRAAVRPAQRHIPLTRGFGTRHVGEWPVSYEAQMREGYLHNSIAQRAVGLVAEGVSSVPLIASHDGAAALVQASSGGQSLLNTLAVHLLLHGNAYVQLLGAPDGSLCELYALRPERVSVEADVRGWPAAFRYKAGEAVTRLGANELVHIRTHHPLDDHYGLGCLGAASGAIAIHNASSRWNKALLDNAARPSGALVHEAAEALSGEQFDRLKEELTAHFSGEANAGRPMLLEGGLKWQALSLSPADMDFGGLKAAAAREIALAFGVPPMLLGLPGDATYANYREANKALYRLAILPLAAKLLHAISEGMQPWFAGLTLKVDENKIAALSEDRERLWAQVNSADFLTAEEKRDVVGLPPSPAAPTEADRENKAGIYELKLNPWHDTQNGQFTHEGQGARFGVSGGNFANNGTPKTKPFGGSGGGQSGGGGASGSWDNPKPKLKLIPAPPKREKIRPRASSSAKPVIQMPGKPATRKVKANGYHFELDEQDRTVRAWGELRLDSAQDRAPHRQRDEGKPDRLQTDHGGHFIGKQFGGPKEAINLFAQDANFNQSDYAKLENLWRGKLKEKKRVQVDIQAYYAGNSKRPDLIVVAYWVDGKRTHKRFPNKSGRTAK